MTIIHKGEGREISPRSSEVKWAAHENEENRLYLSMQTLDKMYLINYNDVIMSSMASSITSLTIVYYSTVIQAQIKEKVKAPRHWPLWGEFTDDRWIPCTKGQYIYIHININNAENVSIWWRLHVTSISLTSWQAYVHYMWHIYSEISGFWNHQVCYMSPQLIVPPCRNYWCRSTNKNVWDLFLLWKGHLAYRIKTNFTTS